MADRLDTPRDKKRTWFERQREARRGDRFGAGAEAFARFMGTARFLIWMTLFCMAWLAWNSWGPEDWRFDTSKYGFTVLTLVLSLQASYAAPLILLAQNRQDDRDRVTADRDRIQADRNLADTEYLAREVAALRIALQEVATRDFLRSELRDLLETIEEPRQTAAASSGNDLSADDPARSGSPANQQPQPPHRGRPDQSGESGPATPKAKSKGKGK
ncbi:MAG: DUF1003 domain-containing protein [Bifidobacteriaceae bacterium]|jgi:uncharacterized membrane protein|nr:DUF1003 domain-containing protein [Bifidobacteriaceae bacterium]